MFGLIFALQIAFCVGVFGLLVFWLAFVLLAWSWGQYQVNSSENSSVNLADILSLASIEWGTFLILGVGQFRLLRPFHKAPPISAREKPIQRQIPVILVPSLHTSAAIFFILSWRLKRHFFTSLWPFSWRHFIQAEVLLRDQLEVFIRDVRNKTGSEEFRIVSFGSSRPIISNVLSGLEFRNACSRWIAISAPKKLGMPAKFLSTPRLLDAYASLKAEVREPDLVIRGARDTLAYPESIWGEQPELLVPDVGHYGALLHSVGVHRVLEEMG